MGRAAQTWGVRMLMLMRVGLKIAALMTLTTALVVGCCAAQVCSSSGQSLGQSQMPSGCHEHGRKAPAGVPNHDCCLTGHHVAVVQMQQLWPPDAVGGARTVACAHDGSTTAVSTVFGHSAIFSSAPPGTAPLRV